MTSGAEWIGRVGDVWAAEWRRTDRSFADLSRHLDAAILAAAPAGAFRALDIGCGAGATSLALAAARPDATILGVDLSAGLVEVARERAAREAVLPRRRDARVKGEYVAEVGPSPAHVQRQANPAGNDAQLTFLVGDAVTAAAAHAPHHLFFSRHGVMFFDDSLAAFTGLRRTAAPGAHLVFSCFGDWSRNAFACEVTAAIGGGPPGAGPGPFALADADRTRTLLNNAGWIVETAVPLDFVYRAGAGEDPVADALTFLQRIGPAAGIIRSADPARRAVLIERLRGVIEAQLRGGTVDFPAAAWIWSAKASLERPRP